MNYATTWRCWFCGKTESVPHAVGTVPPLPAGWVWMPYRSERFAEQPGRVEQSLGCCLDHAKAGAKQYGVPLAVSPL